MEFVDTHLHTTFSYGDGFGTPDQHMARQAEIGRKAASVTEHGNVSSHPQWEKAGKKYGVKPIFGLEAYTALDPESQRKFHLTLLAMSERGYQNLMKIVSLSYEDFYHYPTVSGQMLADWNEDLICLSGCADSLLACSLLGGKTIAPEDAGPKRARAQAMRFRELFGDRFYLETQAFPELARTKSINSFYEPMGKKLGISLVGTQDVHYPYPDDNEMQLILHAASRGSGSVDQQAAGWEYDIRLTPSPTDRIALQRLRDTGLSKGASAEAFASTVEIASRCNVILPKAGRLRYPLDPGQTDKELIWQWLRDGWKYRIAHGNSDMGANREAYSARLKYEMELIVGKDFVDYFLMVSDIVRFAKDDGIPVGPARGSAAASLVCYLLRITEIDPMAFPLMTFERFISPDREDIPDIDLDFDSVQRPRVREYAVQKYGHDRVGNIANYVMFKGKSALDKVARVYPRIPKAAVETLKGTILDRSTGDSRADSALADTIELFPIAKAVVTDYPDLMKATRLEGNMSSMSIHAAGLVIADRPIAETCALYTRVYKKKPGETEDTKVTVVSVNKKDAELLGLMKMDFLGLTTMSMISDCIRMIGMRLDELYAISMNDPKTMEAFRRNDVVGIFQYEGRATRLVNREVKPDTFQELADTNGLSRPGPLFSGTTSDYIGVKWGRLKVEKIHPLWDEISGITKGQIIYQEQVLRALGEIGGLPVNRVHEIRRIISSKLGEAAFNTSSADWIEGAKRIHGIPNETAKKMWGRLVTSASYSFNIAHTVSYSLLAFWCMWLKTHYPVEFYTAQIRTIKEETDWPRLIKDAERHDITVRGVGADSDLTWRADSKARTIQAGWIQFSGVGPSIGAKIIDYRDRIRIEKGAGDEPMTRAELINVNGIGPVLYRKIEAVEVGDPFGLRRVERVLRAVREEISTGKLPLARPTHISDELVDAPRGCRVVFVGMVKSLQYKDFVEDERARSGLDIEEIMRNMRRKDLTISCVLRCYDEYDEDVYIRVNRYQYPNMKKKIETLVLDHDVIMGIGEKSKSLAVGINIPVQRLHVIEPD